MLALDVEFRNFAVVLDARNLIFKNGSTGPQGSELAADPAKGLKNRQFGIEFLHQSDGFRGSRLNALMLATGVCGRLLQTLTSEPLLVESGSETEPHLRMKSIRHCSRSSSLDALVRMPGYQGSRRNNRDENGLRPENRMPRERSVSPNGSDGVGDEGRKNVEHQHKQIQEHTPRKSCPDNAGSRTAGDPLLSRDRGGPPRQQASARLLRRDPALRQRSWRPRGSSTWRARRDGVGLPRSLLPALVGCRILLAGCRNSDRASLSTISILSHGTPVYVDDHEDSGEKHAGTEAEAAGPVTPPGPSPRVSTVHDLASIVLPRLSGRRFRADVKRDENEQQTGGPESPSRLNGKKMLHVIGSETTNERKGKSQGATRQLEEGLIVGVVRCRLSFRQVTSVPVVVHDVMGRSVNTGGQI